MERDRPLFVVAAATRYDGPAYTERHVAEALAAHGDVLWVEPPLSVVGARRRDDLGDSPARPGLRPAAPGITRLVPPTPPGKDRWGVRRVAGLLRAWSVRWALRRDGRRPRAVLGYGARLRPFPGAAPGTVRVAWIKDDLVAGAALTGVDRGRLVAGRRALLDQADVVVAASEQIADGLATEGVPAIVLPAGADVGRFEDAADLPVPSDVRTVRGEAAGFVGQLGDRVDVDLLEAVVDAGIPLLLVGRMARGADRARFRDLLGHPDVTWTGPKPYEELPAYVGAMGVGTVPYVLDDFNLASFPLKLVEYLSAGLEVVSTDLPAARWLTTEHVRVATDGHGFAEAVRAARDARSPQVAAAARSVAATHSWEGRVSDLLAQISETWWHTAH